MSECFVFFRFPNDADRFIFVDVNETGCQNSSRRNALSFFRFPNDADRFIFVDVNETHPLDDHDKIVLFLA